MKHKRIHLAALLSLALAGGAEAFTFTVGPGTADVGGGFPPTEDILFPAGTVGALPTPAVIGTAPGVNVDAYSTTGGLHEFVAFSVDTASFGLPGTAVFGQSAGGEAQSDIFLSSALPGAGNTLLFDGDGLPGTTGFTSTPLGLAEPPGVIDGVNGIDDPLGGLLPMYWSVDGPTTTAIAGYVGTSPADLWTDIPAGGFAGAPILFAAAPALGLVVGDDIDAVHVVEGGGAFGVYDPTDTVFFSLGTGSPSLATYGAGPGDVLAVTGGGLPAVAIPAGFLGLGPSDNLNALTLTPVPEPAGVTLLSLGALALLSRRRPKRD